MISINKTRPDYPKSTLLHELGLLLTKWNVLMEENPFLPAGCLNFDEGRGGVLENRFKDSTALTKSRLKDRLKLFATAKTLFLDIFYEYSWETFSGKGIFADTINHATKMHWEFYSEGTEKALAVEIHTLIAGAKTVHRLLLKDREVERLLDQKFLAAAVAYYDDRYRFIPKTVNVALMELLGEAQQGRFYFKDNFDVSFNYQVEEYLKYRNHFDIANKKSEVNKISYDELLEVVKLFEGFRDDGIPAPQEFLNIINRFPKNEDEFKFAPLSIIFIPRYASVDGNKVDDGVEVRFTYFEDISKIDIEVTPLDQIEFKEMNFIITAEQLRSYVAEDVYPDLSSEPALRA